ncbi:MAG: hypothetical protein IKQ46_02165 [Bacteroidales bacterium]|nr:hypothetical protein [Bacteroidales bacterium]
MGVKEYQFAGDNRHLLNEYHRQLDSLGEWIIQFDAFDKQDYGFDKVSNKKGIYSGSEYYPYLSANYDLRYKSIECYNNDKVVIDFGSYPEKDSVIFKDKYGVTLKLSKGNILNFSGVTDADTNYIYAYRGDEKIGKLSVNTYKWNFEEEDAEDISTSSMVCISEEKALQIINKYHDFYLPDNSVVHIDNANYQASGFIIQDQNRSDSPFTQGTLASLRYLGGDYILYYNSKTLEPKCFRYEIAKNQYSTLINTIDMQNVVNQEDAVKVFVDKKTNRLLLKKNDIIIENVELKGTYTCQQPPTVTLPKYYFDIEDNVAIGEDISNDEEIVNKFVNSIIGNKRLIDNNLSMKLQSKISNYQDNYRLIVKFLEVNKLTSNQESWQQLAKKVYERLGNEFKNNVLVTIPYYVEDGRYFLMPGLYYGKNIIFNDSFSILYKNISSKVTFDENDANEPIVQFLIKVYESIEQFRELDPNKHYDDSVFNSEKFKALSMDIHNQLVELNKIPNLRKPKIKIWIDENELDRDINPNTLKEYIQYAFDNCFEGDDKADFKLGYDLEFIEKKEVKRDNSNIIACFTSKPILKCVCKDCIYNVGGDNDAAVFAEGQKGETLTNESSSSCPIFLIGQSFSTYYSAVYSFFHELCHKITFSGSNSEGAFKFSKLSHTGDANHDMAGLVSSVYHTESYTKEEMMNNGIFYINNNLRLFIMYKEFINNIYKLNY